MRKVMINLLLILIVISSTVFSQKKHYDFKNHYPSMENSFTVESRPLPLEFRTGHVEHNILGVITKKDNEITVGHSYAGSIYRGWAFFEITNIPANATIESIDLIFWVNTASVSSNHLLNIKEMLFNPVVTDASTIYEYIGSSNRIYYQDSPALQQGEYYATLHLDNSAVSNLQYSVGGSTWGLVFQENGDDDSWGSIDGWNWSGDGSSPEPILAITYHLPELTVSPTSLSYSSDGGTKTVSVTSNTDWTITSKPSWITASPTSGNGNATVSLTASANTSTSSRSGNVTFQTTDGSISVPVSITQDKKNSTLSINPTSLSFSSGDETKTVSVTSNTTWKLNSNLPTWIYVNPDIQNGNNSNFPISVYLNPNTSSRSYDIDFKTTDGSNIHATVSITQDGQSPTLSVSPTSLSYSSDGGTKTVSVTSNTDWHIPNKPSWITPSQTSGNGNATVSLTASANTNTSDRSGNVTFQTTDGSISKLVSVTQAGITQYTVSLSSNPSDGGTTTGGGPYNDGTDVPVTATANTGYEFVDWTENSNVVSTESSFNIHVTSDRTLVANFKLIIPDAPSNLTADLITWNNENVIKLTWQDNSNNEEGFKLERRVSSQWSTIAPNLPANTTAYDDNSIQSPYSQYEEYRISCYNSSGTSPTIFSGTVTSVFGSLETPKEYKLSQNYPNPFNPTTEINYSIPKSSFVQIKVYDSRGSIVATLVNSTQSAGYYNVSFNAANLSSGIYLYSINAGDYTKTMKMLLLK